MSDPPRALPVPQGVFFVARGTGAVHRRRPAALIVIAYPPLQEIFELVLRNDKLSEAHKLPVRVHLGCSDHFDDPGDTGRDMHKKHELTTEMRVMKREQGPHPKEISEQ
eukprot:762510-Hanusia_phi.AAC.3